MARTPGQGTASETQSRAPEAGGAEADDTPMVDALVKDLEALAELARVSDINALTLGLAPALAASEVYLSGAHSLSILYENAVEAQQQQTSLAQTSLHAGIIEMRKVAGFFGKAAAWEAGPDKDIVVLLAAVNKLLESSGRR